MLWVLSSELSTQGHRIPQRRIFALLVATLVLACERGPGVYRGAGLPVDSLSVNDQVDVYRAALAGAFTLTDPTLSVLADPFLLPRTSGLTGGDTMPPDVLRAMRSSGLVLGVCRMPLRATGVPLICNAERAGYVARFSAPFALPGDTVQVHLAVQQYAIPGSQPEVRLRFERAYYITRTGTTWRAVREARMSAP